MADSTTPPAPTGPLAGITVLDLSRVLAGPWCSQILGDLGADVIKVEQPGQGDDTRRWGPPFLQDGSHDSAYYLCANRNKRSIAIDIARPEGQSLVKALAAKADIVLENFRVGALARYALDYASLKAIKPDLIYASITGFGQTGPDAQRGGYDFLIQATGGLMSVTGRPDGEPGAGPLRAGIPVADVSTGLYTTISILAALHHRDRTGEGQYIDMALLDVQLAMMANHASNALNGGGTPRATGNQHATITPYQDFACADGTVVVALGNDRQYASFCKLLGREDLAADPRYVQSANRSDNRGTLLPQIEAELIKWKSAELLAALDAAGLPGGRINTVPEALALPQVAARGTVQQIARDDGTPVQFVAFPGKLSRTPANYRHAPPRSAQDSRAVLADALGMDDAEIEALVASGVVADRL